jgi:hypothetical protein
MPVYAHCPRCGLDFESIGFAIQGMENTSLGLATETCPRCGGRARVMEGTFNSRGDDVEIVTAPEWTHALFLRLSKAQVHSLKTAAAWAQQRAADPSTDEERTVKTLEKAIEVNAPAAVGWLERARREFGGNLSGWVAVLMAVITLIVMFGQQGVSADDLERILDDRIQSVPESPEPSAPADPTRP